ARRRGGAARRGGRGAPLARRLPRARQRRRRGGGHARGGGARGGARRPPRGRRARRHALARAGARARRAGARDDALVDLLRALGTRPGGRRGRGVARRARAAQALRAARAAPRAPRDAGGARRSRRPRRRRGGGAPPRDRGVRLRRAGGAGGAGSPGPRAGGPALRLAHHAMQVALADLAARAGDAEEARRLAIEAFAFAERAGLAEPDPWVGDVAGPRVAELALRGGARPGAALARLVASTPDRVDALLAELSADPNPAERARAVELLAARGGRAAFEPLRAAARDPDPEVAAAARAALPALDRRPAYALRVVSLGGLEVWRGETPIRPEDWKGQTARRLLARLLIAEGRPVSRERLLADLWPHVDPGAARNNLRVAIARLNEALDPERPPGTPPWFVLAEDDALRLRPEVIAEWDAA